MRARITSGSAVVTSSTSSATDSFTAGNTFGGASVAVFRIPPTWSSTGSSFWREPCRWLKKAAFFHPVMSSCGVDDNFGTVPSPPLSSGPRTVIVSTFVPASRAAHLVGWKSPITGRMS